MPSKDDEIGALWERESGKGERFLSGKVKVGEVEHEVVVFWNSHKQPGERTPDWRVYKSQPRPDAGAVQNGRGGPPPARYGADRPSGRQVDAAVAAQGPGRPAAGKRTPHPSEGDLSDDIPF